MKPNRIYKDVENNILSHCSDDEDSIEASSLKRQKLVEGHEIEIKPGKSDAP
jgi:hypothetical protein